MVVLSCGTEDIGMDNVTYLCLLWEMVYMYWLTTKEAWAYTKVRCRYQTTKVVYISFDQLSQHTSNCLVAI